MLLVPLNISVITKLETQTESPARTVLISACLAAAENSGWSSTIYMKTFESTPVTIKILPVRNVFFYNQMIFEAKPVPGREEYPKVRRVGWERFWPKRAG